MTNTTEDPPMSEVIIPFHPEAVIIAIDVFSGLIISQSR